MSHAALPVLRTPRLTLRPLTSHDADAMMEGIGNFDVSRWLGRVPYPYARADAEAFIGEVRDENQRVWAICEKGRLVGAVGIEEEFGYWLARPVWRRGYGFEAARAVVEHWFSDTSNGDLETGYFDQNLRSHALLRALGFVVAGYGERLSESLNQTMASTDVVLTRARWEARQGFTLYTPRLVIRPMEARDAGDLASMAVPEVARNMSSLPVGMSLDEARRYIEDSRFGGCPGFRLAIECDGRMIGGLGLGGSPVGVAYFLGPDHWGRGLATETLSAFLPEVFERFPLNRVVADAFEDNPASAAILRRFGFAETGRWMAPSKARLEPAPVITYAVTRETLKVPA